jgi:threonine/homoserine/homoserine lactone efflux protein
VLVTLGLCTGLIVHTTAVAFGVAAIFQTSILASTVLKRKDSSAAAIPA